MFPYACTLMFSTVTLKSVRSLAMKKLFISKPADRKISPLVIAPVPANFG